jgi:hypothetical protein
MLLNAHKLQHRVNIKNPSGPKISYFYYYNNNILKNYFDLMAGRFQRSNTQIWEEEVERHNVD